jgi:hypothetical protein
VHVIVFDPCFEMLHSVKVPQETVVSMFPIIPRKGYRQISVTKALLVHSTVEHIDLTAAYDSVCSVYSP